MIVALAAIAAASAAVAAVVASDVSGPAAASGRSLSTAGAVAVQRRDLVATDTESGTLGYADPQTVYNRLSGTITSLPSVGQVLQPGQTLYEVDDMPVVLFDGSTPTWRDLAPGVSDGPDVRELNRDLADLGFDPYGQIALDDAWQPATTDAVRRWQGSLGESQTGTIALGQIVFLPGAQRITAVDTVLGSTGQAASGGSPGSSTTSAPLTPRTAFVDFSPAAAGPTGPSGPSGPTGARHRRPRRTTAQDPPRQVRQRLAGILSALEALLKAEAAQPKSGAPSPPARRGTQRRRPARAGERRRRRSCRRPRLASSSAWRSTRPWGARRRWARR